MTEKVKENFLTEKIKENFEKVKEIFDCKSKGKFSEKKKHIFFYIIMKIGFINFGLTFFF